MSKLVIVESPAKAKTIGKYLGADYVVKASMGHLRDLPKKKMSIDLEHDFKPEYVPIEGKDKVIKEIRSEIRKADSVYLATDPDREGEAISWHIKELFKLKDSNSRRVTFNEITKQAVRSGIASPRDIDIDLVNAQQARRILDRIVGYQLSPFLWRKVKRGLSAGRVQSVATRLVVDRENEIRAFVPEEYWSIEALLATEDGGTFTARYYGDGSGKAELKNEEQAMRVVNAVTGKPFTVGEIKRGKKKRTPAPPFITSTLQQEASRKLNMTPRRTMSIAQELYEGIELGEYGLTGLITYMRTDSLRLADEATAAAAGFIKGRYGEDYYPGKPRVYKTKSGAQDAHEAIRPSNVQLLPEEIRRYLSPDQQRTGKPGAVGAGKIIDLLQGTARLLHRPGHHCRQCFYVLPAGNFRHHTAIQRMRFNLRSDDIAVYPAVHAHHAGRRFIAGGFNGQQSLHLSAPFFLPGAWPQKGPGPPKQTK